VGNELSLLDFRRDLTLELYNEAGRPSASYQLLRCWISVFQTLPELDASPTARSILRLQLENEGWILDEAPLPPRAADRP
jgi:phage tail-like protein